LVVVVFQVATVKLVEKVIAVKEADQVNLVTSVKLESQDQKGLQVGPEKSAIAVIKARKANVVLPEMMALSVSQESMDKKVSVVYADQKVQLVHQANLA